MALGAKLIFIMNGNVALGLINHNIVSKTLPVYLERLVLSYLEMLQMNTKTL